jgi:hypothetical protein
MMDFGYPQVTEPKILKEWEYFDLNQVYNSGILQVGKASSSTNGGYKCSLLEIRRTQVPKK